MKTTDCAASLLLASLVLAPSLACRSAYYSTMEAFGKAKRDILVDRVEDARDEQTEAKEEFKDALTRFREVTGSTSGELEGKYSRLQDEYEDCASRAEAVTARIEAIEEVSQDLFAEWDKELDSYTNKDLRNASAMQLRTTKERYNELITAMRRVESTMKPVLESFHDQVLFLKHNLNAQAIASLQGQVKSIESDVAKLLRDMDASIDEANAFIDGMPK